MKYYVVDAFTDVLFNGNPAGVCILEEVLDEEVLQSIAAENNLSETAFILKREDCYHLRWFTPITEIDLCGHATLASAYVITNFMDKSKNAGKLHFETKSGILTVVKENDLYVMDFPSRKPSKAPVTPQMEHALNTPVCEAYESRDLLLLLETEQQVKDLVPDFDLIKQLAGHAAIVTAKGTGMDFVSRFFAPNVGVPEDPVTGSAHATLIPFWAERLCKTKMVAAQLSKRGGTVYCEDAGDRVKIAGKAVLYLQGEIKI